MGLTGAPSKPAGHLLSSSPAGRAPQRPGARGQRLPPSEVTSLGAGKLKRSVSSFLQGRWEKEQRAEPGTEPQGPLPRGTPSPAPEARTAGFISEPRRRHLCKGQVIAPGLQRLSQFLKHFICRSETTQPEAPPHSRPERASQACQLQSAALGGRRSSPPRVAGIWHPFVSSCPRPSRSLPAFGTRPSALRFLERDYSRPRGSGIMQ